MLRKSLSRAYEKVKNTENYPLFYLYVKGVQCEELYREYYVKNYIGSTLQYLKKK